MQALVEKDRLLSDAKNKLHDVQTHYHVAQQKVCACVCWLCSRMLSRRRRSDAVVAATFGQRVYI